ncbi:MAG: DUF853 family protein [Lachnospiraceae bacterium]|nr:DUF853 family protein [Lachnospiraceae bacterium]
MYQDKKILVGMAGEEKVYIYPKMANRHGMIAGATGTGKTITLKVMAESFSACGVPVFLADVKGDLSGMCRKGTMNSNVQERVEAMGLDKLGYDFDAYPTTYWDVYEEKGLPLRTTVTEMGPLLLSRILDLNQTQTDIMTILFKIADDNDLLLIDTKDLRAMLQYVGENAKELSLQYGNMSKQSLAAIIRAVVALESEGGDKFFGEPALNIADWFGTDCDGRGNIQVLDCQKLIHHPTMYSTFLLWMMSELFETLPEAGDRDKPKMVFFFDEAHMLFDNASKALLEKVAQVVKLIRSKGVGIYFITQNPRDIPDEVLAQLGNKVQHALHAYTPAEQKAAKAAAMSFRENPAFDTYDTLLELGIGEALVSVLDEKGVPTVVQRTTILPPQSQMGPITDAERESEINGSLLYTKYKDYFDRDSAYEFLQRKSVEAAEAAKQAAEEEAAVKEAKKAEKEAEKKAAAKEKKSNRVVKSVANSAAGTIGREVGNTIGKSIGGSFGKKLGGNIGATLGRGILSTLFKF